ncbi:hypothetical protein HYS91_02170 [Candidatus Daviesbacteria bacterium]|nr:hypothetical protein [Candidatus Daviesbacteria bacterium]
MDKISINLLPPELAQIQKRKEYISFINKITIVCLSIAITVTASVLGYSLVKNQELEKLNSKIANIQNQINDLKDQEGYLFLLKQRLSLINGLISLPNPTLDGANLITSLIPAGVSLLSINSERSVQIGITIEANSTNSLRNLLNNLIDTNTNRGKVTKVRIENINKLKDAIRVDMIVTLK